MTTNSLNFAMPKITPAKDIRSKVIFLIVLFSILLLLRSDKIFDITPSNALESISVLTFIIISYITLSARIVNQGTEALVERLGRYHRKLKPGLNFIVPILDYISFRNSVKEQLLLIKNFSAITKDNVKVKVDYALYWRILELELTYYAIENAEKAMKELANTILYYEILDRNLNQLKTTLSLLEIDKILLSLLDEATEPWGTKVTRIEIQRIESHEPQINSESKIESQDL